MVARAGKMDAGPRPLLRRRVRTERGANADRAGPVAGSDGDLTGQADARGEFAGHVDYLVHRGASSFDGSTIPIAVSASMTALRRPRATARSNRSAAMRGG
jgi:hypothetical protein